MTEKESKSAYKGNTDAHRRGNAKYLKETVEEFKVRVPKGQKDIIKSYAEAHGESLNGFVVRAVNEAMERDK